MKKELLSPDQVTEKLKERLLELKKVLIQKEKAQKNLPEGHLRIDQSHGRNKIQYYHRTDPKNFKGIFIPRAQMDLARRLAQKDYDKKLICQLRSQIKLLENYIRATENKITDIYSKVSKARQALINPVTLTDQQYAEIWESEEYKGLDFRDDAPEYYTTQGERVRSKSEIIIADTLSRHNIPYHYEQPLYLKSGRTIHPDFLCLNLRTRQEFYWEHFGMLDDSDYTENAVLKVKTYNENGIFPGINLIITMETQSRQISTPQVEALIKAYLT